MPGPIVLIALNLGIQAFTSQQNIDVMVEIKISPGARTIKNCKLPANENPSKTVRVWLHPA